MQFDETALQEVRETRFLISQMDDWIYMEIAPYLGSRVLEVGCGLGNQIVRLLNREVVVGIDSDQASISHLKQLYQDMPNVSFYHMDICGKDVLDLRSLELDTVFSLNVLEHIKDDFLALRHMRELLAPGGHAAIPAHPWLYGSIDRALGHYRRYNKSLMAARLAEAGFICRVQKYLNSVATLGWFVNGKLLRSRVPPQNQLKLFNAFVPLIRTLERAVPAPVGISLLAIGKRR